MIIPGLRSLLFAAVFAVACDAGAQVIDWNATLAKARGQTVNWNAWAGDEKTNAFIAWLQRRRSRPSQQPQEADARRGSGIASSMRRHRHRASDR